jgi:hypothetical protein
MNELKELRFNENNIHLKDNLVKGPILPEKAAELERTITIQGNTVIEGAVYAHKIEIRQGNTEIQGAVFTQVETYISSEASGSVIFKKSVGSSQSIVSRGLSCNLNFYADLNAKSVYLTNAFVSGSIFADDIVLNNCVVIGGVFATQQLDISNCIIGTFNSPSVKVSDSVWLLLPSAFSIEKINVLPDTQFYNLSLADLGALYRGETQSKYSGKIRMDFLKDEVKTVLNDNDFQKTIRSYTVAGKVLAADLLDTDKFQNHFLLTASALSSQLLKSYEIGIRADGSSVEVTPENVRDMMFDILHGKLVVQEISGSFKISDITDSLL